MCPQGNEDITLRGQDFGTFQYFDGAYVGTLRLVSCIMTANHTELQCKTPPGAGAQLKATVVVEGQTSDPSDEAVSYLPPVITSVLLLPSCPSPRSCPSAADAVPVDEVSTEGGVAVVIGTNFGDRTLGLQLFVGEEPATKGFVLKQFEDVCPPGLPVAVPPLGYCLLFEVGCRGGASACRGCGIATACLLTPPLLPLVRDHPLRHQGCPDGCIPSSSPSPPPFARSQIIPGDGANRGIQVVLGGQRSAVETYSYSDPVVDVMIVQQSEISPFDNVIILLGRNFGLSGRIVATLVNYTRCGPAPLHAHMPFCPTSFGRACLCVGGGGEGAECPALKKGPLLLRVAASGVARATWHPLPPCRPSLGPARVPFAAPGRRSTVCVKSLCWRAATAPSLSAWTASPCTTAWATACGTPTPR